MLDTRKMLSDVNLEIARLGRIRDLLMMDNGADTGIVPLAVRTVKEAATKQAEQQPPARPKRVLSPEGRANIAAAVKKRWRAAKKKGMTMNGLPLKVKTTKAAKKAAKAPKAQPQPAPAV